jgi:two-component system sensor histidine kinase ComP
LIQNIGLAGALQNFLDLEAGLAPFELSYSIGGSESFEKLDSETKRHVFRVVQELVTNAKKHAGATAVAVRLYASGNELRIHYTDDGAGFDKNAGTNKGLLSSSGLGLEQMKTRVLHLGGRLELQSAPGQGVKANVMIPIREGMTA